MAAATQPRPRGNRFARLAAWSYARRWRALAAWVAVLALVTVASSAVGDDYRNDNSLPGTESQAVADALEKNAPRQAGDTVDVVLEAPGGLRAGATRERVEDMLGQLRRLPGVASVGDLYAEPRSIARGDRIGFVTLRLDGQAGEVPAEDVRRIVDTAREADGEGLRVELGGDAVREAEESESGTEGIGLLAALVILVFLFGSVLAAALPVVTAIFAVGTTIGLIAVASHVAALADFTPPLMMLVGLGVGIDYALLIFARFRSELLGGAERADAVRTAIDTAGRSVFFAACTVVIALLGLFALGLAALQGVALAVALTVLVTMLASLTMLPALLGVFGRRIERRVQRRAERARRPDGHRWERWASLVQRRPWPAIVVAALVLLVLAAPAAGMRLGFADASNDAPSSTSRQAYELMSEGFGPGFNGPFVVVSEGDEEAARELERTLRDAPGVAEVTPPARSGDVSTVLAFPDSKPQAEATEDTLNRLRDDVLPPLERRTGATFLVGGPTAAEEDFSTAVASRMPLFLAVVVGLSSLLLMAVFRSLLIPIKAAVLNLLSIGASLGLVTLVFQEGWFGAEPGPIEAFIPVMIFAIVFGLSMDYEVFLVSRMHEEWERTGDAQAAIRRGLASTGRVITAAGAIMIVVFGAFLLSPERMLQQFGLGLAVAVLLDAFMIRCLILPAVMRLLGERAWWLPGWLERRVPRIALERPKVRA